MNSQKINWLAIVVAGIATFFFGWLWYGGLFTDIWMAGNNIKPGPDETTMFKNGVEHPMSFTPMIVGLVVNIVFAWFIHWLMNQMGGRSLSRGLQIGLMIGIIMFIGVASGNLYAVNPFNLTLVDGGYSLLIWMISGLIVGGWPQKKTAE